MQSFIVIYDIYDSKRLRKVKNIVYAYALSGQKSAREVLLDAKSLNVLVHELSEVIEGEDKVNIVKTSNPLLLGKASQLIFEKNGFIII